MIKTDLHGYEVETKIWNNVLIVPNSFVNIDFLTNHW